MMSEFNLFLKNIFKTYPNSFTIKCIIWIVAFITFLQFCYEYCSNNGLDWVVPRIAPTVISCFIILLFYSLWNICFEFINWMSGCLYQVEVYKKFEETSETPVYKSYEEIGEYLDIKN